MNEAWVAVACTKPSVGDFFVIGGTKQSPTEGLVQSRVAGVCKHSISALP